MKYLTQALLAAFAGFTLAAAVEYYHLTQPVGSVSKDFCSESCTSFEINVSQLHPQED
jgi:hypothetical protein